MREQVAGDDLEIPPATPEVASGQPTAPVGCQVRSPSLAKTGAYLILVALGLFAIVPFQRLLLAAFDEQASIFVKVPSTLDWLEPSSTCSANQDGLRLIVNSLIYSGPGRP